MNQEKFMKSIFEGYCRCFQVGNWHTSTAYSDMTQIDLEFFRQLGNMLGFNSRREIGRMDLSWCEFGSDKIILYLERENKNERALTEATRKLLACPQRVEYLVGLYSWIDQKTLVNAMKHIDSEMRQGRDNTNFLQIAYIGDNPDRANEILGIVWCNGKAQYRKAKAEMNKAGYWYIYFEDDSAWIDGLPCGVM